MLQFALLISLYSKFTMSDLAILLMGPTATGKTQLALQLSTFYPIEIISVDSALIYKDMNIGTAKPTVQELEQVPHHLINIISPLESYSVANFITQSSALIKAISKRGKLPVLVGGTMMYYNALLNGISKLPEADDNIRQQLHARGLELGWEDLYDELKSIDNIAALKIMPNDQQRIIRALEVFYLTGRPISQLQQENKTIPTTDVNFLKLAILPSTREILHQRINQRFINMLNNGFIEEVKYLQQKYPQLTIAHSAMRCVGYYQVWKYLSGELSYAQLIDAGMAATRQLAKRQITWLKNMAVINLDDKQNLDLDSMFIQLLKLIKLLRFVN
ncbi:MAG: tRNA (adenosine(37)-N6)-dimethylallyltransferase MiaA [Burkholderiales bacterium]|nr:tRNA (adenosine(37)-N6)-dimethylallyltransferase MiaA [Burkholderiales bacterium]